MNSAARKENKLSLLHLLNLSEENSEKILGSSILITIEGEYPRLIEFLKVMLEKTFETVHTSPSANIRYDCEIVTSSRYKNNNGTTVYLCADQGNLIVTLEDSKNNLPENLHPFFYFLITCYTGAIVLRALFKEIPISGPAEISFDPKKIVTDQNLLHKTVSVGRSYLAGAGAVGNAFLFALSTFHPQGEIFVTDPDFVSEGNLNRCLYFDDSDINYKKAEVLVKKAQPHFEKLNLVPIPSELAKVENNNGRAWLDKLIVGVDSRRARRNLQGEVPKEVFDASTTGISEIVLHYHKRPLDGACLGCIYVKEKVEEAHEKHIAEALGVSLNDVKQQFVSKDAARLIAEKNNVAINDIIGLPYDTLFKQLCGEGKLMTKENVQVLAPLAFVSALAGAFLALMFIERHSGLGDYNYWRLSPWSNINYRLKQNVPTNPDCEFCNSKTYQKVARNLWPE
jgi:hypothetical protein